MLENTVTPSSEQWKSLILGARNAMNSWAKSDSDSCNYPEKCFAKCEKHQCEVGDHFVNIAAPLYW